VLLDTRPRTNPSRLTMAPVTRMLPEASAPLCLSVMVTAPLRDGGFPTHVPPQGAAHVHARRGVRHARAPALTNSPTPTRSRTPVLVMIFPFLRAAPRYSLWHFAIAALLFAASTVLIVYLTG
jgi:hypothetical protein